MTEEQFNRIINAMPNKIDEDQMIAIFATIIEGSILFGIALMMRLNCSSVMRLPYLLIDNIIDAITDTD